MLRYLGTIAVADSTSKNNTNTATPFVIPPGTTGLKFAPSASPIYGEVSQEQLANATGQVSSAASTFATTANGFPLTNPASNLTTVQHVVNCSPLNWGMRRVVAVYNASGNAATVNVYADIGD